MIVATTWHRTGMLSTSEFPPPTIEAAWDNRTERILRRIAAAMLERPDVNDVDVLVGDANRPTFSYYRGYLAFKPASQRGQEYLDGWRQEHLDKQAQGCLAKSKVQLWWPDPCDADRYCVVLDHQEGEALIEELERRGHKLGVQLGYTPTKLDRRLRRIRNELNDLPAGLGILAGLASVVVLLPSAERIYDFYVRLLFGIVSPVVVGLVTCLAVRLPLRPLRKVLEAKIEKRNAARLESWKRALRAG